MKPLNNQVRLGKKSLSLSEKFKLRTFLEIVLLLTLSSASALVFPADEFISRPTNHVIPFQARLFDAEGGVVSDGVYQVEFRVYATEASGVPTWYEAHPSVSVIGGYINVLLGAMPVQPGTDSLGQALGELDLRNQHAFLGISIGTYASGVLTPSSELFPRHRLVPSFHAKTSDYAIQAQYAEQANNSNKLGGQLPNYYAAISYVDSTFSSITSSITNITSYFGVDGEGVSTGVALNAEHALLADHATNADNADLLDGVDINDIARKDVGGNQVFNGDVVAPVVRGNTRLETGADGAGNSSIRFYDDNSDAWRKIQWDDGNDAFIHEKKDGSMSYLGGGWDLLWSGDVPGGDGVYDGSGKGLFLVITSQNDGADWFTSLVWVADFINTPDYWGSLGGDNRVRYNPVNQQWYATTGRIRRIFKLSNPVGNP